MLLVPMLPQMVPLLVPLLLSLLLDPTAPIFIPRVYCCLLNRMNCCFIDRIFLPKHMALHPDHEGLNLTFYNLNLDPNLRGMATEQEEMLRDPWVCN